MYAMKSIFNVFFLFAMLAMSTSNNGVALAKTLRKDPLKVNKKITVVGTSYVSGKLLRSSNDGTIAPMPIDN